MTNQHPTTDMEQRPDFALAFLDASTDQGLDGAEVVS
jgi:hypothetical protein